MATSIYFDYSKVLVGKTIKSIDQVEGSLILYLDDGSVLKILMSLYYPPEEAHNA